MESFIAKHLADKAVRRDSVMEKLVDLQHIAAAGELTKAQAKSLLEYAEELELEPAEVDAGIQMIKRCRELEELVAKRPAVIAAQTAAREAVHAHEAETARIVRTRNDEERALSRVASEAMYQLDLISQAAPELKDLHKNNWRFLRVPNPEEERRRCNFVHLAGNETLPDPVDAFMVIDVAKLISDASQFRPLGELLPIRRPDQTPEEFRHLIDLAAEAQSLRWTDVFYLKRAADSLPPAQHCRIKAVTVEELLLERERRDPDSMRFIRQPAQTQDQLDSCMNAVRIAYRVWKGIEDSANRHPATSSTSLSAVAAERRESRATRFDN